LSLLAHDVVSIELDPDLSRGATGVLMELGCANVKFLVGDGSRGWPPDAPYDGILVAAAAAHCPPPLREQLAGGGVLVIPIGGPAWQELARIERRGTQYESEILTRCRFVPLVGAAGSDDE
jgi:protein-L-isoaspartate(D-aspartate) O-methyltransferase